MKGEDWLDADPYVRRHAAEHAAQGGMLDSLVVDPGYLAVAETARLLPVLGSLTESPALRLASVYRRIAADVSAADPLERISLLHLKALQESPESAGLLEQLLVPFWRARWAWWRRTVPFTVVSPLQRHERSALVTVLRGDGTDPLAIAVAGTALRCWDLSTLSELARSDDLGIVPTAVAAWRSGGDSGVAAGFDDGAIRLFDLPSLRPVAEHPAHDGKIAALIAIDSADAPLLASGGHDGRIVLWHLPKLEPVAHVDRATGIVHKLTTVPTRRGVALVCAGDAAPAEGSPTPAAVGVWSLPDLGWLGSPEPQLRYAPDAFGAPLDPGGVVITTDRGAVRCWDPDSGVTATLDRRDVYVSGGQHVVLERTQGTSLLLVFGDGTRALRVTRRDGALSVDVSGFIEPDYGSVGGVVDVMGHSTVVTVGQDLRLWDTEALRAATEQVPVANDEMLVLQQSYGIKSVVGCTRAVWSGSDGGGLQRWDPLDGRQVGELLNHGSAVEALARIRADDRDLILVGAKAGAFHVLDAGTAQQLCPPINVGTELTDVAATTASSGPLAATTGRTVASDAYEVRIWRVPSGEPFENEMNKRRRRVEKLRQERGLGSRDERESDNSLRFAGWSDKTLSAVTFLTAAGRTLVAAAGSPPSIEIWDVETGDTAHSIELGFDYNDRTAALASYAHNAGAVLVAGSQGGGIRAWSIPGSQLQFDGARAHIGEVRVCIGLWDGDDVLLTGGHDGALKVWSIADWQCIRTIPIGERIWSIAMAPTGDVIVGTRRGLVSISPGAVAAKGST